MLDSNQTHLLFLLVIQKAFSLPFQQIYTWLKLYGTLGWNSGPWNVGGNGWSFRVDPTSPSYRSPHNFSPLHLLTGFGYPGPLGGLHMENSETSLMKQRARNPSSLGEQ